MLIKNLKINNLRNLKSVDLSPHPGLNILHGDNGAGKTSVIESLVVLAKGRSFRSGQIASLIGPENDSFLVVAQTFDEQGREHKMGLERSATDWQARLDGRDVTQLSDLASRVPLALLEPNSHLLISGPPDGRRRFLDWGVFHVEQGYLVTWRRYSRAVKQRNAALRNKDGVMTKSLDPLVEELGQTIDIARNQQVNALTNYLEDIIHRLSPALPSVRLTYEKGWKGVSLREALEASRPRDLERGATGPGPHRADLNIILNGQPARERLSRGEQKILSAALILSQAGLMAASGETPLLLLDDVSSEFDQGHLKAVMSLGLELGAQIWVTSTSIAHYAFIERNKCRMFHVEQGEIHVAENPQTPHH